MAFHLELSEFNHQAWLQPLEFKGRVLGGDIPAPASEAHFLQTLAGSV